MAQGISLIAGLGNPGKGYADSRHNVGLRFLEMLRKVIGASLKSENRFSANIGKAGIGGREVWLLAPTTFMNLSGDAVARFARFYKIPPREILVIHDDLDLPPGAVRLKLGGGHGGHNGLRDIIAKLGSNEFVRLRIGIGHPGSSSQVESYVLKKAPPAERDLTKNAIERAETQIEDIVHGNYELVMNELHTSRV